MPNVPAFISPRTDLTIRSVPPEKMEAICNAIVHILGGRVEFSESAIYESVRQDEPSFRSKHCGHRREHPPHGWTFNNVNYACSGGA
jgi:hypothetical protein